MRVATSESEGRPEDRAVPFRLSAWIAPQPLSLSATGASTEGLAENNDSGRPVGCPRRLGP